MWCVVCLCGVCCVMSVWCVYVFSGVCFVSLLCCVCLCVLFRVYLCVLFRVYLCDLVCASVVCLCCAWLCLCVVLRGVPWYELWCVVFSLCTVRCGLCCVW